MGLFGRREPAPRAQIHSDDQDLVAEDDERWWDTLTLKGCQAMERQDNQVKVAALIQYMESDGMSEEDAARKVRRSFAAYYSSLEDRKDEPFGFGGDDAKLPYILKDRINRMVIGSVRSREKARAEFDAHTSFNALVRRKIRAQQI